MARSVFVSCLSHVILIADTKFRIILVTCNIITVTTAMLHEYALFNSIFKQLVVCAIRKWKEIDSDLNDASDLICFYK